MLLNVAKRVGVELDAETQEKVVNEQIRMVWAHAAVAAVVASAFAVVAAVHLLATVEFDHHVIHTWVVLKLLAAAPRVFLSQIYRRKGYPSGRSWRMMTYALLAIDGAVWGAAGLWLMDGDIKTASFVTASLCCVACVATFGFQVSRVATSAYVVPIVVPMMIGMTLRGDAFGVYGAVGLSLFLAQVLVTAGRSDSKLSEVFLLRIHAARISAEKQEALEQVQRHSAAKSQFLGTVSHELRTPIHGILGVARVAHVEMSDPSLKKRMELIEASGMHLLGLVTDLIDVSRIESGEMRIQRYAFDLHGEIERIADIYSVRAAEKELSFTLDSSVNGPMWVTGDPVRLRQVLHNLLGNAIKFTQKGWVNLSVKPGAPAGEMHFEVRDTGVGISEGDQKVVFNAFQQVGSLAGTSRQGTGLGLTIAREIAVLLGGGITLKSRPGFGSVFDFWVQLEPAVEPSTLDRAKEPVVGQDVGAGARILLVEDNDVNALVAGSMLANQGHQCERATDGIEAVKKAFRGPDRPDLILMDCMMPNMGGFEATRIIRAQELALGLDRVPIIALSAIIDEETHQESIACGMDDALSKPFANDELRDVMRPWLALRESKRSGTLVDLRPRRQVS